MAKLLLIPSMVALAVAVALVAPAVANPSVSVGDNYFVRPAGVPLVSVARGSRVAFRWAGRGLHNAKGIGVALGATCGSARTAGTCLTPALTRPGTYTVYCSIHGRADMSMKLRVR